MLRTVLIATTLLGLLGALAEHVRGPDGRSDNERATQAVQTLVGATGRPADPPSGNAGGLARLGTD